MDRMIDIKDAKSVNENDLEQITGGTEAAQVYAAAEKRVKEVTGCRKDCHCYECTRPYAKGRVIIGLPR
ncbi:MAG: hypothetical protein CW338_06845 [Clostridiales bacterium]|jgi:hypothetical protein|nr:hypothetical protein [Clostridiales bacterium]